MAASKIATLAIFLALIFSHVWADVSVDGQVEGDLVEVVGSVEDDSSALKIELEKLNSKIRELESHVDKVTQELEKKDEIISEKEKIIRDKSDGLSSLQSEIASIQKQGKLDTEERLGKAHARVNELEKQAAALKRELEMQTKLAEAFKARSDEAEKKILELSSKVEALQKINDEQQKKIRKTERVLKVSEEEVMRAKFEAMSKTKELKEVHGAWLPPWIASHMMICQSFMKTYWKEQGRPAMDLAIQKALEGKAQAEKWAEPHVEAFKTKWIPAMKEQLHGLKKNAEPHIQLLITKTLTAYEASKSAVTPHLIRAQEFADPYVQEARKVSKPYIDQVSAVAKPHIDKARVLLEPYARKFLKSVTLTHEQIQASFKEHLKKHEYTRPLATKEFVWIAASASLGLPVIMLFNLFFALFGKKARKPVQTANSHRRKAKRGHSDK